MSSEVALTIVPPSAIDPSLVSKEMRGEPNSFKDFPNGDRRHFGDNGVADYDYHSTDHGNPKIHPHDKNGGHFQDWDYYKENGKTKKGKPYIPDENGEKDYNPKRDDREKNKQDFSWLLPTVGTLFLLSLFLFFFLSCLLLLIESAAILVA